MKRFLCATWLLFLVQLSFGQLSIKPSEKGAANFLYLKDRILFVSHDLNLSKNNSAETESSIYLRDGSQLIQGEQQRTANVGTGYLSVFQEGTSNSYDYNYWGSPVSSPENGFFGISLLGAPQSITRSTPAKITSGLNGTASPLTISSQWIFSFSGQDYSAWKHIGNKTILTPGVGFTMKGVDGKDATIVDGRENNPGNAQRYDFKGKPNSGTIEIPINSDDIVLLGNPYPSAIDLSLFLLENSGSGVVNNSCHGDIVRNEITTGIAYYWDSREDGNSHYFNDYIGGYGAFSPVDPCTTGVYEKPIFKSYGPEGKSPHSSGHHIERRFLPIAQGFMVQGVENGKIRFKNSQRIFKKEGSNSQFKQRETSQKGDNKGGLMVIPKLRLEVSINDSYIRGLTLAFWPSATIDTDAGMDAAAYDLAPADVGFLQQDRNFSIDVRPFELTDEIPLFLVVGDQPSKFSFAVGNHENFQTKNILILDSEMNVYYPLTSENPVELMLQKGNYNGRFKIAFQDKTALAELPMELTIPVEEDHGFSVFQNNLMNELEVICDSFSPVKSIGVFDLHGKRIFFRSNFENRRSIGISTVHWAPAVYIVKITNTNGQTTTKKISVYKR